VQFAYFVPFVGVHDAFLGTPRGVVSGNPVHCAIVTLCNYGVKI
jgi:hypothetical protein